MKLSDSQNIVNVESVHYSNDGTVTLKLSDKRELKLAAEVWSGLEQPRDNPLTDSQQEILEREACYTMIQNKMLSFLAVREHSAQELRRKIKQRFFKIATCDVSALVERCLQEMQERDFQSDERFARRFTESKLSNKPYGPFKILQDLQRRGISREQAQAVLNEFGNQGFWLKKAVDCLVLLQKNKKIQTTEALSQKLYQRGFSRETIEHALKEYQIIEAQSDAGEFDPVPEVLTTENP